MKYLLISYLVIQSIIAISQTKNHVLVSTQGGNKNGINYSVGQFYTTKSFKSLEAYYTQGFQQNTVKQNPDSLPYFNIGEIPNSTVYQGVKFSYFVYSKELGSNANFYIKSKRQINSKINFKSGKFEITALKSFAGRDTIVFFGYLNNDTIFQNVYFDIIPEFSPEVAAFGLNSKIPLSDPNSDEFVIITKTINPSRPFNIGNNITKNVSIAGKTLIFDKAIKNKLYEFTNPDLNDIYELNIYAEDIIIRGQMNWPQAGLTIYCRNIIFEDKTNENALINIKPLISGPIASPGQNGRHGQNASINIENIFSKEAIRFYLNGGDGQSTNNNSNAGDGGNGSNVTSNIDIMCFTDINGGIGGSVKGSSAFIGDKGGNGLFFNTQKRYSWVHPNVLRMIIRYVKAGYLNGNTQEFEQDLEEYKSIIEDYQNSNEWTSLDEVLQVEIEQLSDEISNLLYRFTSNLDYFGNPIGWVPMLSFEVNKIAFEEEIPRAIKQLYFSYWVQRALNTNEKRSDALKNARNQLKNSIVEDQKTYDEQIQKVPLIQERLQDISSQDSLIVIELNEKEKELAQRAKYLVEKAHECNWLCKGRKITRVVGSLAQLIPIPAVMIAGTALVAVSNIDFSKPLEALESFGEAVGPVAEAEWGKVTKQFSNELGKLNPSKLNTDDTKFKDYIAYSKNLINTSAKIFKGVKSFKDNLKGFGGTAVPPEEIENQYEKLKAESPEYLMIIEKAQELSMEKGEVIQDLVLQIKIMGEAIENIQSSLITIDALNLEESNLSSQYSLRAMIYSKEMETRAKDRLLRYQYIMAKAYEYRLVQSYPLELDLSFIFEEVKKVVSQGSNLELSDSTFNNLKTIYDEVLSSITSIILNEYNTNAPSRGTKISFRLTHEELELLNNDIPLRLNLVERGIFPPNAEDIRIIELKAIDTFKTHFINGYPNSFANIALKLQHSGLSKLKKNGEVYYFNHYNNQNTNPIIWTARYDALSRKLNPDQPSISSESMLRVLLEKLSMYNSNNVILYSRPSAWADIIVTKESSISNNVGIILDQVVFEIDYEYRERKKELVNLEITTNNEMKPLYTISRPDNNSRKDGYGFIERSYNKSSVQSIIISAPLNYGNWKFEKWIDLSNGNEQKASSLSLSLFKDNKMHCKYTLIQPVLNTPYDTIRLPVISNTGRYEVQNIGNGEMNWKVVGSNEWFKLKSDSIGINTGTFSYTFLTNNSGSQRSTYIVVQAGESIDYLDTIVIIQTLSTTPSLDYNLSKFIKIFPNPNKGILNVEANIGNILEMKLYNVSGKYLKSIIITKGTNKVDLSDLRSGIYFITALQDGILYHSKISKL